MRPMSMLAAAILLVIAVAHLVRLVVGAEIVVAGTPVPMWMSGAATVSLGLVAILLMRERRKQ